MEYTDTIEIEKDELDRYERMFNYGKAELIENGIPPFTNIKAWTAKFSNGLEADIKVNSSENDVWSEGVLFTENGLEITHTEICDNLTGVWEFEANGDTHRVEVKGRGV